MNLNGYTLKAVKTMETPDGISFSGNIYFSNKKIGTAYNGGFGGMTDVHLLPDYRDHYSVLNEDFVERLFTLHDYEKIYKAELRKSPNMGVVFVTYNNPFDLRYVLFKQDKTSDEVQSHIQKTSNGKEIEAVELFRSLDDFNVTESFEVNQTAFKDMSDWDMAKDYSGAERFSDGSRPLIAETRFADIVISGIPDKDKVIIVIRPYGEMCDYFYEGYTATKASAVQIGNEIEKYINTNEDGQFMFSNGSFRKFFVNLNITKIRTHDFKDEILPDTSEFELNNELDQGEEM